jgi:hypothetical protein
MNDDPNRRVRLVMVSPQSRTSGRSIIRTGRNWQEHSPFGHDIRLAVRASILLE